MVQEIIHMEHQLYSLIQQGGSPGIVYLGPLLRVSEGYSPVSSYSLTVVSTGEQSSKLPKVISRIHLFAVVGLNSGFFMLAGCS